MTPAEARHGYQVGRNVIGCRNGIWYWLCLDCGAGMGTVKNSDALGTSNQADAESGARRHKCPT